MSEFRYEHKYLLSLAEYRLIKGRIGPLMSVDANARGGSYSVRSLYFESAARICYAGKKAGLYSRCKYRLRMYRFDPLTLRFEQKRKLGEQVGKRVVRLSAVDASRLIEADYSPLLAAGEEAIYYDLVGGAFQPCLIIDYVREPYVYEPAKVRITFDYDVVSRPRVGDFFREISPGVPVSEGMSVIMEIKHRGWLPLWLKRTLQERTGSRQSISKYCLGFSAAPVLR